MNSFILLINIVTTSDLSDQTFDTYIQGCLLLPGVALDLILFEPWQHFIQRGIVVCLVLSTSWSLPVCNLLAIKWLSGTRGKWSIGVARVRPRVYLSPHRNRRAYMADKTSVYRQIVNLKWRRSNITTIK